MSGDVPYLNAASPSAIVSDGLSDSTSASHSTKSEYLNGRGNGQSIEYSQGLPTTNSLNVNTGSNLHTTVDTSLNGQQQPEGLESLNRDLSLATFGLADFDNQSNVAVNLTTLPQQPQGGTNAYAHANMNAYSTESTELSDPPNSVSVGCSPGWSRTESWSWSLNPHQSSHAMAYPTDALNWNRFPPASLPPHPPSPFSFLDLPADESQLRPQPQPQLQPPLQPQPQPQPPQPQQFSSFFVSSNLGTSSAAAPSISLNPVVGVVSGSRIVNSIVISTATDPGSLECFNPTRYTESMLGFYFPSFDELCPREKIKSDGWTVNENHKKSKEAAPFLFKIPSVVPMTLSRSDDKKRDQKKIQLA